LNPYLNEHINRFQVNRNTVSDEYDKLLNINFDTGKLIPISESNILRDRKFSNLMIELMTHTKTLMPIYDRIGENIKVIDSIVTKGNSYSIGN
jgi:hypothetical protein